MLLCDRNDINAKFLVIRARMLDLLWCVYIDYIYTAAQTYEEHIGAIVHAVVLSIIISKFCLYRYM